MSTRNIKPLGLWAATDGVVRDDASFTVDFELFEHGRVVTEHEAHQYAAVGCRPVSADMPLTHFWIDGSVN